MSSGEPLSRLAFAVSEIDRVLGLHYAREHSEVVCSVMASAASDYAAMTIARVLDNIAAALLEDAREFSPQAGLVRADGRVLR